MFLFTMFFIALFSKRDNKHKRALELFHQVKEKRIALYTCWFIISEAITILRYHYGYTEAFTFSESLDLYDIMYPTKKTFYEALTVFNQYSKDKKISFVDALSYVIICQQLKKIPALSFDKDFISLGLTVIL